MKPSDRIIDFIKSFEGFREMPYQDVGGILTVGYGHVITGQEDVHLMIYPLTKIAAKALLLTDVSIAANAISEYVFVPLSQGKYDAMTSLIYNWGVKNFARSTGLRRLNDHDYNGAADAWFNPDHGVVRVKGKRIAGLIRRRKQELEIWNS